MIGRLSLYCCHFDFSFGLNCCVLVCCFEEGCCKCFILTNSVFEFSGYCVYELDFGVCGFSCGFGLVFIAWFWDLGTCAFNLVLFDLCFCLIRLSNLGLCLLIDSLLYYIWLLICILGLLGLVCGLLCVLVLHGG